MLPSADLADPDRARAIPWRDIVRGRHVARGGHKNISHARWCTAPVVIAQPIDAPSGSLQSTIARQSFNKRLFALYDEAFLLVSLQHPNIITLFGVTVVSHGEQHRLPALVLEAALCTLDTRLTDDFESITSCQKLQMMKDISCALAYLHDRGVTHNDIKADNILVAQDGHTLKIADLSSVRTHEFSPSAAAPEIIARCLTPFEVSQAEDVARHQRRMQDAFLAAEWQNAMYSIFGGDLPPASKEADVYSCGLVFSIILTGERHIYESGNQTLLSLFLLKLTLPPTFYRDHASGRCGEALPDAIGDCFDEEVGADLLAMVRRCCSSMAAARPCAREILEIIAGFDSDDQRLSSSEPSGAFSVNGPPDVPRPIICD